MMLPETGTKQQFKCCVLDTMCVCVYCCGHVYIPGAAALDCAPGEVVTLYNTECDECKKAKQEARYNILMYAH